MATTTVSSTWRELAEAILKGVADWRHQHPHATMRDIEGEIDQRLAGLRAQLLTDVAQQSEKAQWTESTRGVRCPQCGTALKKRGRKKRTLATNYGQAIVLERDYGVCPQCGQGFFPPG